eukprot:scaffold155087_cov32-Tisochrysis_lutea.AAC.1
MHAQTSKDKDARSNTQPRADARSNAQQKGHAAGRYSVVANLMLDVFTTTKGKTLRHYFQRKA